MPLPFQRVRFILKQMCHSQFVLHSDQKSQPMRSNPMAKSNPTPTQQTGGTTPAQQQGQETASGQQQGQTVFRDWASI
jgi:hypothetical protein